jgi:hypothetical protein
MFEMKPWFGPDNVVIMFLHDEHDWSAEKIAKELSKMGFAEELLRPKRIIDMIVSRKR